MHCIQQINFDHFLTWFALIILTLMEHQMDNLRDILRQSSLSLSLVLGDLQEENHKHPQTNYPNSAFSGAQHFAKPPLSTVKK